MPVSGNTIPVILTFWAANRYVQEFGGPCHNGFDSANAANDGQREIRFEVILADEAGALSSAELTPSLS